MKEDFKSDAATVSGWIVEQLGALPQVGDEFRYGKISVTITDVDEKRVREAIIKIDPPSEEEE